ncbi:ABC transporter ATP-binding protein [Streptomyces sp. NPDC091412]|uniref:ABC transporter ATP-binding protein n=1 Tax=Streptomyces sp. NPDC091412 TaxID=3366002 RepID=UPI0038128505
MNATVRTEAVSVHFAGVKALQDVDLELAQGEILGLIGPNGAGKTTLVNVLSGYQNPSTGRVWLNSTDLTRRRPARRAREGLVRTFQNVRLFPELSVLDNILLGALGTGRRTADGLRLATSLLESAHLTNWARTEARALPYGAARRLGIARALATRPRFVLLDEPAAGLNDSESADLVELLRMMPAQFGVGLLLIEHDMHVVMSVSQRIHVLDFGRTLAVGTPEEIKLNPEVQRAYFGRPVEVPHAQGE